VALFGAASGCCRSIEISPKADFYKKQVKVIVFIGLYE